jgi:hypothetical protein
VPCCPTTTATNAGWRPCTISSIRSLRDEGATGLGDLTVALSLELAKALEEIAQEQDLAAVDLAEVWFAD